MTRAAVRLAVLQQRHQGDLREAAAAAAPAMAHASCRAGCAACCAQHIGCTPLEVLTLAQAIAAHPRAAELWARVAAQAAAVRAHPGCRDRFLARIACPLLEPDGTCAAYEARPTSCRQHAVVNDPAVCGPPLGRIAFIADLRVLFQGVRLREASRAAEAGLVLGAEIGLELALALDVLRQMPSAEAAWLEGAWPFATAAWPCGCERCQQKEVSS